MKQKGLSLVEVLLVIGIVGFLSLLIANIPNSIRLVSYSNHQSLAREIATKVVEDVRSTPYANIANGSFTINDSRINSLPSGSGTKLIEDYESEKQVTVTINWKDRTNQQLILKTIVAEGGLK